MFYLITTVTLTIDTLELYMSALLIKKHGHNFQPTANGPTVVGIFYFVEDESQVFIAFLQIHPVSNWYRCILASVMKKDSFKAPFRWIYKQHPFIFIVGDIKFAHQLGNIRTIDQVLLFLKVRPRSLVRSLCSTWEKGCDESPPEGGIRYRTLELLDFRSFCWRDD